MMKITLNNILLHLYALPSQIVITDCNNLKFVYNIRKDGEFQGAVFQDCLEFTSYYDIKWWMYDKFDDTLNLWGSHNKKALF